MWKGCCVPGLSPEVSSLNPADKRLAILVEDHPLEYIDFEGIIPRGMAGAGPVLVWNAGTFELLEKKEDRIVFNVEGKVLQGDSPWSGSRAGDGATNGS